MILGREISVDGGDGGEEVQTGGGLGAELTSGGLPDWVTTGEGLDNPTLEHSRQLPGLQADNQGAITFETVHSVELQYFSTTYLQNHTKDSSSQCVF